MTGEDLKAWMASRGYSVRSLARTLDVAPSTVTRWREGESPIPKTAELALRWLEEHETQ